MPAADLSEDIGLISTLEPQFRPFFRNYSSDSNRMVAPNLIPRTCSGVIGFGAGHCKVVVMAGKGEKVQFKVAQGREEFVGK